MKTQIIIFLDERNTLAQKHIGTETESKVFFRYGKFSLFIAEHSAFARIKKTSQGKTPTSAIVREIHPRETCRPERTQTQCPLGYGKPNRSIMLLIPGNRKNRN